MKLIIPILACVAFFYWGFAACSSFTIDELDGLRQEVKLLKLEINLLRAKW